MIPFPNVSPEIFSFSIAGFEVALRWYALSYIAGFVCAIYLMKYFTRRQHLWRFGTPPFELEQIDLIFTHLILGVIIGGRIGYVVFYNFDFYLNNPFDILKVWDGGMSFHGGFLGVVIAVFVFCKHNGIPVLSGADMVALASPPGLLFGRLANFINGELWGRPTDLPWGVAFPGPRAQNCPGVEGLCARHPSQLYEAGLEGLFLFVLLVSFARLGFLKRSGFICGGFLFVYGLSRYFIEFFRVADPQFASPENPLGYAFVFGKFGIQMGQVLSMPMIVIGLLLLLFSCRARGRG